MVSASRSGVDAGGRLDLCLGVDIGSVACKTVVCDRSGRLVDRSYDRTEGRPIQTLLRRLERLLQTYPPSSFSLVAGTGSAGRLACQAWGIGPVNEVICQAVAIKRLAPDVRTLIEMGGQDSKILFLPDGDGGGQPILDFAMNTNCAAGTGSFLDQQASRLKIDINGEFGELALKSTNPPRVAGRCSVFAKSDMIHLQQQATPLCDIIMGLCLGLARNLKSNLGRAQEFHRPIAFCGGVASNKGVVRAFEEVFELARGELVVPPEHAVTGALGAVLVRLLAGQVAPLPRDALGRLRALIGENRRRGHRLDPLKEPTNGRPRGEVYGKDLSAWLRARDNGDRIDAYLGLDVGSISTKIAIVDERNRVLTKCYLMTEGRPLEAVRRCLAQAGRQVGQLVRIRGAATTGSGRYLTGAFIGADLVINEITAQAHAAALIDPEVDTIFEIGGQDSKYISLAGGVVVDFEMNHACAAGTGSFLEEQAERLGIRIEEQFAGLALGSASPVKLGERCTVFMESDLLSHLQQGADTGDLVAGLSYSIVANYINRVVGRRRIGEHIFFQGGTAFNRAVVAAFEAVTGKPITVPPHHEVTGAIGAAALAHKYQAEKRQSESNFHGFELAEVHYDVRSFVCEGCSNHCEIKEVRMPDRDPLYFGSRCDRYNTRKTSTDMAAIPNLFTERHKLLLKYSNLGRKKRPGAMTVGIPLTLGNYQLLPFWATFLGELGMNVVLSGRSTRELVRRGVEAVASTPCFPVKVAHGHVLALIDKQVDAIWLPSVVSMARDHRDAERNQLCPYVQTIPYQVSVAVEPQRRGVKLINVPVRFQEGQGALIRCLLPLRKELGVSLARIRRAVEAAEKAQDAFEEACRQRGREVLAGHVPGRRTVVIISRPYNGCDPGVSLDLPEKLRKLNVLPVPMDFLDLRSGDLPGDQVFSNMYWKYGQRILRAARAVREDERLWAIFLSNFSCGPDSFLISYFKRIMGPKPSLLLEIDEHSADAGVVTRLEAFLESLSNADGAKAGPLTPLYPSRKVDCGRRTIYVPWMGDGSYGLAAAFRGCGQPAEVLPLATDQTLELGRRLTNGKECLPCVVTAGDMLAKCREPGFDPQGAAFFMPGGSGPCRFGQYNCLHKILLNEAGHDEIPVISPSQDKNFYADFKQFRRDPTRAAWVGVAAIDILTKALHAIRPYETTGGETDRVYVESRDGVCELIAAGAAESDVVDCMKEAARRFADIGVDRSRPRPKIGVVGEIYVRCHSFCNQDLIRTLEALGAAVSLASVGEWLYYTNFTRMRTARRERSWRIWAGNFVKNRVQRKIERRLAAPFAPLLGHVTEPPIKELIALARPYMHDSFEGEAIMSIGKIVELHHAGCDGAVNAMPFTCMPSTIVSGIMKRLTRDLDGMPAISISYDGQQDPTLHTRLEAFVHQADAYRQNRSGTSTGAPVPAMPRPTGQWRTKPLPVPPEAPAQRPCVSAAPPSDGF